MSSLSFNFHFTPARFGDHYLLSLPSIAMVKRKAEEPLQRSLYSIPPAKLPAITNAVPRTNIVPMPYVHPPFHPPVAANQLVDCRVGLCQYCNYLSDVKLKYEVLFGRPQHPDPAPPTVKDTEDEEDDPTIREDNMAFEKICELEAKVESLQQELNQLRKQGRCSPMPEIKKEDDGGYGRVDDSAVELRDLKEESSDEDSSSDVPYTPTPRRDTRQKLADHEEPFPSWSTPSVDVPSDWLHTPPARHEHVAERGSSRPKEVFAVLFWNAGEFEEGTRSALKGIYRDVGRANSAAWEVYKEQDRIRQIQDLDDNLELQGPWGKRHVGEHGEVAYSFGDGCDGDAYVKVKRLRLL